MREIKFRAVNKNNEFIYGLPYTDGTNETAYFKEYNNRLCWRREPDGAHCNQPYKNGTLSQYTGLKDKNGTEIYDGDLLTDMVGDVFEVFYNTAHCAYMAEYVRTKHAEKKRGYFRLGDQCSLTIEVIGNIYENPELLK